MQTKCDTETSSKTSSATELGCDLDNEIDSSFQHEYDQATDSMSEETGSTNSTIRPTSCLIKDLKFIMFFSSLFPLLKVCMPCPASACFLNYYKKVPH